MSTQITTAFVKQYTDNVMLLVQQQGSRLRNAVRLETGKIGEEVFMERIGSTNAQEVTSRHADSPLIDTPHDRRRVVPKSYDWGDMVDNSDKLRMLIDPASPYAVNAAYAMGRAMDDLVISEALGTAFTGKGGATSQTLPAGQKVAVNFHTYDSGSGDVGLTIGKLIEARRILGSGEADDYDIGGRPNMFVVANAKQLAKLLTDTSLGGSSGSGGISAASADFNSVRALVSGELDTFMGFQFIRSERTTTDGNSDDQVIAFHRDGIGLCLWEDVRARITERADKRFSTYVYLNMTIGSVRLEEERVVEIACDPT
jgi:hypothetical protein|tara:strand:+ start:441 stop:1382 length:942 start_codon:yes stop_codon:yes gene_type:complete